MTSSRFSGAFFVLCVLSVSGISFDTSAEPSPDWFVDVVEKVMPSVVNLSSTTSIERPIVLPFPFDELFFGKPRPTMKVTSLGSAVLIDVTGILITSNHVVDSMSEVRIRFTDSPDERPIPGQVIGRDPDLDIALVRVDLNKKIEAIRLGDSDRVRVGEFVLALGNPFGQGLTASHGILSAKGRSIPGGPAGMFLQTDVPINPGNSGGPLLNAKGEVIGINTAIRYNAQGISFAIPVNRIKEVLPELLEKGHVDRGDLGMVVESLRPEVARHLKIPQETQAAIVTTVMDQRPASKAGIRPYDLIVSVRGKPISGATGLVSLFQEMKIGEEIEFLILRNGKERKIMVTVGKKTARSGSTIEKQEKEIVLIHPESGVRVENLPDASGVLITGVIPGSPAERAGMMLGDIVLEMDLLPLRNVTQYRNSVSKGKKHLFRLSRSRMGTDSCTILEIDLS